MKIEPTTERFGGGMIGLLPGIRCPYCGHKILYKVRSPTARRIKAI